MSGMAAAELLKRLVRIDTKLNTVIQHFIGDLPAEPIDSMTPVERLEAKVGALAQKLPEVVGRLEKRTERIEKAVGLTWEDEHDG